MRHLFIAHMVGYITVVRNAGVFQSATIIDKNHNVESVKEQASVSIIDKNTDVFNV